MEQLVTKYLCQQVPPIAKFIENALLTGYRGALLVKYSKKASNL
jgi:hypothetical protein